MSAKLSGTGTVKDRTPIKDSKSQPVMADSTGSSSIPASIQIRHIGLSS